MTRTTVIVEPDADPTLPNHIEAFIHCAQCLSIRPAGVSPAEWARLEVGFCHDGTIQVWCHRCNLNVATIAISLKESD